MIRAQGVPGRWGRKIERPKRSSNERLESEFAIRYLITSLTVFEFKGGTRSIFTDQPILSLISRRIDPFLPTAVPGSVHKTRTSRMQASKKMSSTPASSGISASITVRASSSEDNRSLWGRIITRRRIALAIFPVRPWPPPKAEGSIVFIAIVAPSKPTSYAIPLGTNSDIFSFTSGSESRAFIFNHIFSRRLQRRGRPPHNAESRQVLLQRLLTMPSVSSRVSIRNPFEVIEQRSMPSPLAASRPAEARNALAARFRA